MKKYYIVLYTLLTSVVDTAISKPPRDPFQIACLNEKKKQRSMKKQPAAQLVAKLLGIVQSSTGYGALIKINNTIEAIKEGDRVDTFYVTSITPTTVVLKQGEMEKILTLIAD